MKSLLFKILALAFLAVAAPAHAYWGHTYVNAYINAVDYTFFGQRFGDAIGEPSCSDGTGTIFYTYPTTFTLKGGLPILRSFLRIDDKHKRHQMIIIASILGVAAVAYKTYKHFTKPAADATDEDENIEANETTVEVA